MATGTPPRPAKSAAAPRLSVTDEAISKVKDLIVARQLSPGQKLPREQDLATLLGLSRSSLREAVRALSLMGVLEVRQGDGTYVTSLQPRVLLEALTFAMDVFQDDTVHELFEVRRLVEPAATALAAARITNSELAELQADLVRMEESTSVEELVERDVQFHQAIIGAAGNATLESITRGLAHQTTRVRIWRGMLDDGVIQRTHHEHRAIYDALRARDAELARACAVVHVAESERWLKMNLEARHSRRD